jgi:hypothetical protein
MEVLTFVAGLAAVLITWWISEHRARRAPYRSKLQGLLRLQPFQLTELIANDLRGQLDDLEYPHLVTYFETLPDTDPRKFNWRQRIDRLHTLNSVTKQLISERIGEASPPLREALSAFTDHAMAWEDMWIALKTGNSATNEDIRVPAFPKQLMEALGKEIADTTRQGDPESAGQRRLVPPQTYPPRPVNRAPLQLSAGKQPPHSV